MERGPGMQADLLDARSARLGSELVRCILAGGSDIQNEVAVRSSGNRPALGHLPAHSAECLAGDPFAVLIGGPWRQIVLRRQVSALIGRAEDNPDRASRRVHLRLAYSIGIHGCEDTRGDLAGQLSGRDGQVSGTGSSQPDVARKAIRT